MKRNKKLSVVAISVASLLYFGEIKEAQACCGDGAIAAAGATTAGGTVAAAVSTSTSVIVGWLAMIQQTISMGFSGVMGEITMQTAQIKQFEEARLSVEESVRMEQLAADAYSKYEPSPRSCYEVAGGAAISAASGGTTEQAVALNQSATARGMNTKSSAVALKNTSEINKKFAAKTGDLKNADIRADNLTNNSSLGAEQLEAAVAFVDNVVNPIPVQILPDEDLKSEQGQVFMAHLSQNQALLSVAYNSFNNSIASKTPIEGLGSSALFSKADVSEEELMEAMIKGRFETPGWYQMLAGFDEPNLLREQNKQAALGAWMDLKRYRQLERIELLLATELAFNVKNQSKDELNKSRATALRGG